MKSWISIACALTALVGMSAPAAAQEQSVDGRDPETVRRLFEAWGYRPTPIEIVGEDAVFQVTIADLENVVVLDGCQRGRNCSHMVLIVTYDDVPNPPYEWMNRQNFDYNLVTTMRREDGLLTLRTGIMLGTAGVPASVMRAALDDWVAANNEIAQRAVSAGLVRD